MFTRTKRLLAAPVFSDRNSQDQNSEDEDKTRIAGLLNVILLTIVFMSVVYGVATLLTDPDPLPPLVIAGMGIPLGLGLRFLVQHGHVRLASVLLSSALWVIITISVVFFGGVRDPGFSTYFVVVLIASLLSGGHSGIVFSGLSIVAGLVILHAETSGMLPPSLAPGTPTSAWVLQTAILILMTVFLNLTTRSINTALERARHSAQALTESNRELEDSRAALETYARSLKRRSTQLEASAKVGQAATTILDTDQLVHEVVELIHKQFDLYYVGLFLLDESGEWAVLRAAAGEVGRRMLAQGYRRKVDETSIVGTVTSRGEPHIVSDVESVNGWETDKRIECGGMGVRECGGVGVWECGTPTHSQMVLPLRASGRIIGALDVKADQNPSAEPKAFGDEEMAVFQMMADQIAVAIDNARLYQAVQQELRERRRTEEVLRESECRFHTLFDGLPVSCWTFDRDGTIMDWNRACEALYGWTAEEAVGKTMYDLMVKKENIPSTRETIAAVFEGQFFQGLEYEDVRADGTTCNVLANEYPFKDVHGRVVMGVCAELDITKRKQAEERLARYAAELGQANEDLRRFTYVASHNLRGPLVNLKGFTAELRAALALIGSIVITTLPHLEEKQQEVVAMTLEEGIPEALGFIDASVSDLDRLVTAIRNLSSLSYREMRRKPVDINALIQATLNTLADQMEERQVTVTVGPLPEVVADQVAMAEILTHLLRNAVLYLDPDRPGEIEITAERNQGETLFRVQDNGRGIAEGDMDKVFAPFRRAGRQDVPGEGMGLPYVQTLVRRHGGRIWYESELGVGTTFTFTIPNHPDEGNNHV